MTLIGHTNEFVYFSFFAFIFRYKSISIVVNKSVPEIYHHEVSLNYRSVHYHLISFAAECVCARARVVYEVHAKISHMEVLLFQRFFNFQNN